MKRDDREGQGSGVGQALDWPAAQPKGGLKARRGRCPLYNEERKALEFISLTGYSCTRYGTQDRDLETIGNISVPVEVPSDPPSLTDPTPAEILPALKIGVSAPSLLRAISQSVPVSKRAFFAQQW